MGLRSNDEPCGTSPGDTYDLLQQRGTLRRLVREAMASMIQDEKWTREATAILAMSNWAEYEVRL